MKKIMTLIIILIVFTFSGCRNIYNHSKEEVRDYAKHLVGHDNFTVSTFRKTDGQEKYWEIKDKTNNFSFRIIATHYRSGKLNYPCLSNNIDDIFLEKAYTLADKQKNNVTLKKYEQVYKGSIDYYLGNGKDSDQDYDGDVCEYTMTYLTCSFSTERELNDCYDSFRYYNTEINKVAEDSGYKVTHFNHEYIYKDNFSSCSFRFGIGYAPHYKSNYDKVYTDRTEYEDVMAQYEYARDIGCRN